MDSFEEIKQVIKQALKDFDTDTPIAAEDIASSADDYDLSADYYIWQD